MDPALLTAISALGVAVLAGAASVWQLALQNRHSRRQAAESQILQLRLSEERQHQDAIVSLCTALQSFQDELLLAARASALALESPAQRDRLVAARDRVLVAYQENHALLSPDEREAGLRAREICVDVAFMLSVEQTNTSEQESFGARNQAVVQRVAFELSNAHQQLLVGGLHRLGYVVGSAQHALTLRDRQ